MVSFFFFYSEEIFFFFISGVGGVLKAKQFVIKYIHFLLHCSSPFDVVLSAKKGVD